VYRAKPKFGISASAPDQVWHLDQTTLRLEDGTRAFVQAIIENFSRYVLAWHVSESCGGGQTAKLLMRVVRKAKELGLSVIPNVFVDSGALEYQCQFRPTRFGYPDFKDDRTNRG